MCFLSILPCPDRGIQSSLWLQTILYFNAYFSIVYGVLQFWMVVHKYNNYKGWRIEYLSPMMLAIFVVTEPPRLYIGWQGNLKEDVPSMTTFLFVTVFISTFIITYNLFIQLPLYPFDTIFGATYIIFIVAETALGLVLSRLLIKVKTTRFRVEHAVPVSDDMGVEMASFLGNAYNNANAPSLPSSNVSSSRLNLRTRRGGSWDD